MVLIVGKLFLYKKKENFVYKLVKYLKALI